MSLCVFLGCDFRMGKNKQKVEKNQQKNATRRLLTTKDKHDRFIATYVKIKHQDVYAEAYSFYTELDQTYPTKRDLRKTAEFLHRTEGIESMYDHYYQNKLNKKKNSQSVKDNMVLKIQLMAKSIGSLSTDVHVDEIQTGSLSTDVHVDEIQTGSLSTDVHVDEIQTGSLSTDVHVDEIQTGSLSTDVHVDEIQTGSLSTNEPLVLPDNVYQDLLNELAQDKDLKAILNDFEMFEEDINELTQDKDLKAVLNDFEMFEEDIIDELVPGPNEETPLEWELHNLGY